MRTLNFFCIFFCLLLEGHMFAQHKFEPELVLSPEICDKGSAQLIIKGQGQPDSSYIQWSTGEVDQKHLNGLMSGDYSVRVFIEHRDSLRHRFDTTLTFHIEKEVCPVSVGRYFSPNGDDYNDKLGISNLYAYPDFELIIYNKMGQRVHHQEKTYVEWDGKWLGTDLPDGTYYYVLFFDKKHKNDFLKGDITILR